MFQHRVVGMVIAFAAVNLSYSAQAQIAAPGSPPVPASGAATGVTVPASKENITVIGRSPVPGATRDQNTLPTKSYKLTPADIDRTGIPNLTGAMLDNIPGVTINETEGNVFQPDILFRGFTASPVAGTSEGLAVYLNGARFNEAFADTVNWDLITPIAINSVMIGKAIVTAVSAIMPTPWPTKMLSMTL